MNLDFNSYYNLAERIEDTFSEIDSDVCENLRSGDSEYNDMCCEAEKLQKDFPVIMLIIDGDGAVSLSAEEHGALIRYLNLKHEMEDIERKAIYFRGHTDGFS
jgi:hypothetical protein